MNIVEFVHDLLQRMVPTLIYDTRIGSGTGIFTRAILADPKWNARIKSLKAVEPSQGMRDVFAQRVKDDRISQSEGFFDATGVEDGWADLVVIAQVQYNHYCWISFIDIFIRLTIGVQITTKHQLNLLVFSSLTEYLPLFGIWRTGTAMFFTCY